MPHPPNRIDLAVVVAGLIGASCPFSVAAPWIAADWAGREPSFPPGSLYWHTHRYRTCPIFFRTVLEVEREPVKFAGFTARASQYAYVFLNGRQIAARAERGAGHHTEPFAVELTHRLEPGSNVLVVSTGSAGFSLEEEPVTV